MKKFHSDAMYDDMHYLFREITKMVSLSEYYFVVKNKSKFIFLYAIRYLIHLRKIYKLFSEYIYSTNIPIYTLFYEIINIYNSFIHSSMFKLQHSNLTLDNFVFIFKYNYDSFHIMLTKAIGINNAYFCLNTDDNTISATVDTVINSTIFRFTIYPYDLESKLYDGITMDCVKKKSMRLLRESFDKFIKYILVTITKSSLSRSKMHPKYKSFVVKFLYKYVFK